MNKECTNGEMRQAAPCWFEGGKINEIRFLDYLRQRHHFRCVRGVFYDEHGRVFSDAEILNEITDALREVMASNLNRRSRELLALMKARWDYRLGEPDETVIHVLNGTIDLLQKRFTEKEQFTIHRLGAPFYADAPKPKRFLEFLDQLLYPEDIPTVQEFMGYCLIPTNRAQKMLVISGTGGEGKSVLGRVIKMMLGDAAVINSVQKIATNPFARADLEHKLVMIDDDMSLSALTQTHYLKTLITLEGETDLEKKGQQSYQGRIFARFIGLTNGSLTSLYDQSDGFYRRQILLHTKPRDRNRVNDPYLAEYLFAEVPGILLWCLQGLDRLQKNDYRFTESDRAKANLKKLLVEADSVRAFLQSRGYVVLDPGGCVSTADLTQAYRRFCQENAMTPLSDASFRMRVAQRAQELGLRQTKHIPTQQHKDVRGYLGIRLEFPELRGER